MHDEATVNRLAQELDKSPAAIRAALDNLLSRGLIERVEPRPC